MVSNIYGAFYI